MKLLKKIIIIIYAGKIVLTAKTSNLLKFIVHATHLFIFLPSSYLYISSLSTFLLSTTDTKWSHHKNTYFTLLSAALVIVNCRYSPKVGLQWLAQLGYSNVHQWGVIYNYTYNLAYNLKLAFLSFSFFILFSELHRKK